MEESRGRKTKLTPAVQAAVIKALEAGNYFAVACEVAGIGERTGYRWLERGEKATSGPYRQFWQSVKIAEAKAEASAVQSVRKAMATQWQAPMTFLERKFPERWARRERLDQTHDVSPVLARLVQGWQQLRDEPPLPRQALPDAPSDAIAADTAPAPRRIVPPQLENEPDWTLLDHANQRGSEDEAEDDRLPPRRPARPLQFPQGPSPTQQALQQLLALMGG
jgi:transposase